jgi:hypothetical protein
MTVPLGKDKENAENEKDRPGGTPQDLFKDIYSMLGFRTT